MCVYVYVYIKTYVCVCIYTHLCTYINVCAGISQLAACRVPLLHKLGLGKSYTGNFLKQNRRFASRRLICCAFPLESAVKRFAALIPTKSGFFL